MRVAAAIHSYDAIPRPRANPEPLIPMNCSAEIFEAISDAPMAHHVSDPSARKKSFRIVVGILFLLIYPVSVESYQYKIEKEDKDIAC